MSGMIGYALGYDAGRSDEQIGNHQRKVVHQILYGERPVTVDQSYIDRLHAALDSANDASIHNYNASSQWEAKAQQFKNEALYWRDEKYAPARAKAKARREENATLQAEIAALRDENAVLLARLQERNPDLAEEQAAHDERPSRKNRACNASAFSRLLLSTPFSPAAPTGRSSPNCSRSPRTPPTPSNAAICSPLFATSRKKTTDFVASPTLCKSPDFPRGVRAAFHHDGPRSPRSPS